MNKQGLLGRRLAVETVEVGDGETVQVRELTGAEGQELARLHNSGKQDAGIAWVTCKTLVNEDGSRMFEDRELAQVAALPLKLLKAVSDKAIELSGMSDKSRDDAKKN